jgi:hypothetical protein
MLRKSLILGCITLLMVMLFAFTGCEGPVGPAGPAGVDNGTKAGDGQAGPDYYESGPLVSFSDVKDADLAAAFEYGNIVILQTGVETVYGVVPAGKILYVMGPNTKVAGGQVLTIKGTLDIMEEAATLSATGITTPGIAVGTLVADSDAVIKGKGAVILPYVFSGDYTSVLTFNNEAVRNAPVACYPGSAFLSGDAPVSLNSGHIRDIFELEDPADNTLTVQDVFGLGPVAIPAGKTLVLKGKNNTITTNFELNNYGSSLVVAENAELTVSGASDLSTGVQGIITNKGTIKLGPSATITAGASFFVNDGEIQSSTDAKLAIEKLISLDGSGTIKLNPVLVANVDGTALDAVHLRQNVVIEPANTGANVYTYTLKLANVEKPLGGSSPGRVITLANEYSILDLGVLSAGVGTAVRNTKGGKVFTATTSSAVLTTLFNEMGKWGNVVGTGAVTSIGADFEIPEGVTLSFTSDSTTFGTGDHDIIVKGTLILEGTSSGVSAVPAGNVIVEGSLKLLKTSSLKPPSGSITIKGTLDMGTGDTEIEVAGAGILSLPSVGITGSGSNAKIIAPFNQIRIDDKEGGFGTEAGGILPEKFESAVRDIRLAASGLKKVPLAAGAGYNSTQTSYDVVGWGLVASSSEGTRLIYEEGVSPNPNKYVGIPLDITVYSQGIYDNSFWLGGTKGSFKDNDFSLTNEVVADENYLAVADSLWAGSTAGSFVALFNEVRFVCNGLIGPTVEPFYIAVRSSRS